MKKSLILLIFMLVFTSCGCLLSQVPPQTIYADSNCEGILPDYTTMVLASDNCEGPITISQTPIAGTKLTVVNPTINVVVVARDVFGNMSKPLSISVSLIDTIPPVLSWPIGQVNMTEDDILNLYRNWEAGVKVHGAAKWVYDQSWTQGLPFADTTAIINGLKIFTHAIELTDDEYAQYVSYIESNK